MKTVRHPREFGREDLREVMTYDPETGLFTSTASHLRGEGRILGTADGSGYIVIGMRNRIFRAHRLAFMWMNGMWPTRQVDHINGIRGDNRWRNLRDVSPTVNAQNKRAASPKSKTGLLGVSPHRGGTRWLAYIRIPGTKKTRYVGIFKTPEAAHEAYVRAKRELHEGCTI